MYIKVETKIKQIKNNYWNYRKSIVFKIKLKYNKSILFIEGIFVEGGEHFEFIRFNLAINVLLLLSNSKDDENQNSQD